MSTPAPDDEAPWRSRIDGAIARLVPELIAFRRDLHENPEPSLSEHETTSKVADRLRRAGISVRVQPDGLGLIAGMLDTPTHGYGISALRADMDALRIQDAKDVAYHSRRPGVMHACGHDAHTAMALGASLALQEAGVPGWRAVFQPAEEEGDGAQRMVDAGAVEGVRSIVALHVDPERSVGEVGWRIGALTACCVEFEVTVTGRGGHAARPHLAIEPIPAAAQYILAVHQSVPRAIDSREPAVVTFGAVKGGTQHNVIPDRVHLRGTIRTFSRPVADLAIARMQSIADGLSLATGAVIELQHSFSVDAVINDPAVTTTMTEEAARIFGSRSVREIALPSLGGEDFSAYGRPVPGCCMMRLGVARPGEAPWPSLHNPSFDIDESALPLGARLLARTVARLSQAT
jgi:amidohydrolase